MNASEPAAGGHRAGLVDRLLAAGQRPEPVAAMFWGGGAVTVVSSLALHRWSGHVGVLLAAIAGVAVVGAAVRASPLELPGWSLHLDVALAIGLIAVLQWLGGPAHVPFDILYVWAGLFSAMFFPPRWVVTHVAAIGASFAGLLAAEATAPGAAAASWLVVVGTAAVATAAVAGLVGQLRATAVLDPLTRLPNRRAWEARLAEEMGRARRSRQPLTLAVVDLDRFKALNDRLGHRAGDRALQAIATAWRTGIGRDGDFIARLGGDEFAILTPATPGAGLEQLIDRLRAGGPAGVPFSAGIATWDRAESAAAIVHRADRAMYRAKARAAVPGRTAVLSGR